MTVSTAPHPGPPTAAGPGTASRAGRLAGVLYLVTFVTSIPALALLEPVLRDAGSLTAAGGDTRAQVGTLLDLLNAAAAVGTAVVLFPVLRRFGEACALGFVASRLFEAVAVLVGAIAVLSLTTLHRGADVEGAASGATLSPVREALVAVHDWAFLLGPGLVPGVNALLLGSLLLGSRLVPRGIPLLGLAGAPLLLGSATATVLGAFDQVSAAAAVLALPVALWELSLGIWLTAKGLRPTADAFPAT